MTDDKDVSALTFGGAGAAPSAEGGVAGQRIVPDPAYVVSAAYDTRSDMLFTNRPAAHGFAAINEVIEAMRGGATEIKLRPFPLPKLAYAVSVPTADQIVVWLDTWLREPITERERTLIVETIWALQHPDDIHKANGEIPTTPTDGALLEPSKGQAPPSSSKVTI